MIKNTSQNRSQNHQKSIKNRSKIGPWSGPESLLSSWSHRDPPRTLLERTVRPSWTLPGPILGPTWAQLEPTWSQLGPNLDPKFGQGASFKSLQRTIINSSGSHTTLGVAARRYWENLARPLRRCITDLDQIKLSTLTISI